MKRILSLTLALVMLIGMLPMQVFATEGTQEVELVEVVTEPTEATEAPEEEAEVAHEHEYATAVTAPTCTEKGYTTYTCECGDNYVGDVFLDITDRFEWNEGYVISAFNGNMLADKNWVASDYVDISAFDSIEIVTGDTVNANTTLGIAFYDSNQKFVSGVVHTDKTGTEYGILVHNLEVPQGVTYLRTTWYSVNHGSYNGATLHTFYCKGTGSAIPPLGHSYVLTDETKPNCSAGGTKVYTCSSCGEITRETTAKGDHIYEGGICVGCDSSILGNNWIAPNFAEGDYSIVVLPDTQKLVASWEDSYYEQMQWIADNKDALNIQAVLHMGDMVDNNTAKEWTICETGTDILQAAGIPWMPMRGNHDNADSFNNYYDYTTYGVNQSWFGGAYHSDKLEHTYWFVTVGQREYMILSLGWAPSWDVLEWAKTVVAENADKNVILACHAYMNSDGTLLDSGDAHCPSSYHPGYPDGDDVWDAFKSYENVVLAMGGHIHSSDIVTFVDQNGAGQDVTSLLVDRQNDDMANHYAMVALLTFHNDSNTVEVNWYSVRYDALYRAKNQFSINVPHIHTHEYVSEITVPTCTEQGYTTYTCVCGDSYVDDYTDATGEHSYENGACVGCGEKEPITAIPISMRYDDHLDMTGKVVEIIDAGTPTSYQVGYGVEENAVHDTAVVTMKGNTLIATGIGTAKVKIDGETYEITVTAAPISLLLLIGQSNMRGSEGNAEQSIVCPDGMVYATFGDDRGDAEGIMNVNNATNFAASALTGEYSTINVNGTTNNLSYYPINSLTEAGKGTFGPDSGFAYEWVKQTGEKVWVVNAAHGGSAISSWQPNATNFKEAVLLFSACQETLRKEITAGHFTLSHMGYFWCQGCNDAAMTAEQYVAKYLTMHEGLESALDFDHDSNAATETVDFEFAGIIPILYGVNSYRAGTYLDKNTYNYYQSFEQLTFNGPRVAQYWMTNNPELKDIWMVCNIGEDWVWMPDGTNGVSAYFQNHYANGTVDYTTQVAQKASWYTPTTPAAVHDSIHYNQIGYNEVGRESARNALIMLGEIEAPDVEVTVELLSWDGYTTVNKISASLAGKSGTLIVPKIYPVWKSKDVSYTLTEGFTWSYYDVLASDEGLAGELTMGDKTVTIEGHNWSEWETLYEASADSPGKQERACSHCDKVETREIDGVWQIYKLADHLLELPEDVCCDTNLWAILPHEDVHFTSGLKWGYVSVPVPSVTIPMNAGDRVYATSFIAKGDNGGPHSGIRLTFFDAYGVAWSVDPTVAYKEWKNKGYIEAPEGTIAANLPMWYDSEDYELYIINREHAYENGICGGCGATNGPVITQQPESSQQEIGKKFAITVKAEGDGLIYQWYYKDAGMKEFKVSSNKTASYAYTMQTYMHNRQVYCVITDQYGNQVTTETATITRPPMELALTAQPQSVQVAIGEKFSVKPAVQGDALTYQWYYKDSYMKDFAVSSNKTSAYAYTMQSYMHNRQVYCVITDQYGKEVTTEVATITRPPVELKILTQPNGVNMVLGEKFSIKAEVQGDGLTYQWYYKESYQKTFSASSNKTSAYAYSMASYMNGRQVYCVITDQYGNQVTTETVTIHINN